MLTSLMEESTEQKETDKKVNVVNVLDCSLKNKDECLSIVSELIDKKNQSNN